MKTLFDAAEREEILARLARLTPDATPGWGTLTPATLLPHLIDTFRITFAEVPVEVRGGLLATAPVRWLALRVPIPKNVKAPPEFHQAEPGDFAADHDRVLAYIRRFADGPDQTWGPSPLLGRMSGKQWARLHRTHLRHHCRQFGL